ncbi:transmembrane protein, putative (macronuclear) [Tetrahymena thermophila SB210]|uniref:Transmembrane protein, putative n=1 Tax=Tetrahymena thermophila (strain SB210) TaxID=312017 RepID=Q22XU1_TETTS|nr:transmembrane protein, putative [Tetrahymena thermophila SB210]EAR90080.1 transmembrane protein, putative [Tetrahymena thermophila SB210]|eukprot:XP_001010325.1 transmembrane protein, putative [Tetrahymena thermophila SB210]
MLSLKDLKVFDIFAPTYQQKVLNGSNKRQTIIGGLFSIVIVLLCLAYAVYLFQNYVNGSYQPKQNDYTSYSPTEKLFDLKLNNIKILIFNENETLLQNEMRNKIQYFTISLSVISNHKVVQQYLAEECYNQALEKQVGIKSGFYYCFGKQNTNQPIQLEQSEYKNTSLKIDFNYCQQNQVNQGYRCASLIEANSYLYDQNNNFQILLETDIYNLHKNQDINTFYIQDLFPKPHEILNNVMQLQLTNIQIIQGIIIQYSSTKTYFYNFLNENYYIPLSTNPDQINPISTEIKLDKPIKYETIQFVPITQVLSEAWTTISLLLVLGNIARIISETGFMIDLIQIQLKFYYKKTAKKLCPQDEDQYNSQNTLNDSAQNVIKINEKVENTNYKKNIQNYFNLSKWQKFSIFYLPSICQKRKDKTEEQITLENLIKQTNNEMNIYEMHKELLKMKLLLKMLVSPEQYAAIQMCGCDILQNASTDMKVNENKDNIDLTLKGDESKKVDDSTSFNIFTKYQERQSKLNDNIIKNDLQVIISEDQNEKYKNKPSNQQQINVQMQILDKTIKQKKILHLTNKQQQLNHLEILNKIDLDPNFKKEQLEKFLSQDKGKYQDNVLNQRIRSCMLGLETPSINSLQAIFKLNYNIEQIQPKLNPVV